MTPFLFAMIVEYIMSTFLRKNLWYVIAKVQSQLHSPLLISTKLRKIKFDQKWSVNLDKEKCEYCNGKPLLDRKPLMSNDKGDYTVFINRCNYLEDSEVGDRSKKYSLFGIKIKYCPACGREL